MGNDLDRSPEVVAAALLGDDRFVDLAGGHVGRAGEHHFGETFVMTQVQIGLGTIVGHEDLAVLVRTHRARIDVDIGVELQEVHSVAMGFEQAPDGCGRNTLSQRRDHSPGNEDELGLG